MVRKGDRPSYTQPDPFDQYDRVKRAVIVSSGESYRTRDFLAAAELLRLDYILASDALTPIAGANQIEVDLADTDAAARTIAAVEPSPDVVIAIDDQGVLVAAAASRLLNLAHNPAGAVAATRDKGLMRALLHKAGVRQPDFRLAGVGDVPEVAASIGFPVVIKPRTLSASRGVIRADNSGAALIAESRIRAILSAAGENAAGELLVESFISGDEIAIEGLVDRGEIEVLAVIDKPVSLDGPYFEETLFVTPSRHPGEAVREAVDVVQDAVSALGLVTGPVHAEVRLTEHGPHLVEVAGRTIGGLCGRALSFGLLGESLEALVLKAALGLGTADHSPARPASGVLMLPIPAAGVLSEVEGISEALQIEGIDGVEITVPRGRSVTPLPEGDRYLGFVFASGMNPAAVEDALRLAAQELTVNIDGESMRPAVE